MRTQVQSLALFSGLRIQWCHELWYGAQTAHDLAVVDRADVAVASCRSHAGTELRQREGDDGAENFESDPDTGLISAYTGTDVDVVVPREIDGVTVVGFDLQK